VIGIPDDKWGEAVKAIVVMKPGKQATATDIINFTRERIAGFIFIGHASRELEERPRPELKDIWRTWTPPAV